MEIPEGSQGGQPGATDVMSVACPITVEIGTDKLLAMLEYRDQNQTLVDFNKRFRIPRAI